VNRIQKVLEGANLKLRGVASSGRIREGSPRERWSLVQWARACAHSKWAPGKRHGRLQRQVGGAQGGLANQKSTVLRRR
jgi:hypothetical protein